MAFTIVTEAEQQFMAGENADATGNVTANRQFLHDYAAGYLGLMLETDIIADWASITATYKFMITEWAARFAGMSLIAYNMITWATNTSIIEAEDLIQTHIYRIEQIEKILKQVGVKKLLGLPV
jgi:hypothetical protein